MGHQDTVASRQGEGTGPNLLTRALHRAPHWGQWAQLVPKTPSAPELQPCLPRPRSFSWPPPPPMGCLPEISPGRSSRLWGFLMSSVNVFSVSTHSPSSPTLKIRQNQQMAATCPRSGLPALPEGWLQGCNLRHQADRGPTFRQRPARASRLSWPTAGAQRSQSSV